MLDELGPLWETDLQRAVVGAVLDKVDQHLKRGGPEFAHVPRVRDYFNAGVLLIDLGKWREERIAEKAVEYLIRHPRSPYPDQDALDVVCGGLRKNLDPRWNFQDYYERKRISDMHPHQRPGIVHFVYNAKPWNASIPNLNASFYDVFRSRTCFARTPSDKPWDKPWDAFRGVWSRWKRVLTRYIFLRLIWRRIRTLGLEVNKRRSG